MNKLCYVAKPQQWESPKGVLMRTALHNGYQNVAFMCTALKVPCTGDGLDLLTEESPIMRILAMVTPTIEQSIMANTYAVENTEAALWIIDEFSVCRSNFLHHFAYCPKCLSEELITVFQDIHGLTICPIHRTRIITKCSDCHQTEHWTTANLLFCKCGSDRRNTTCKNGKLLREQNLETFGPDTYLPQLSRITEIAQICENIWHSRQSENEQKPCFLLDTVRQHATTMINTQVAKYPGFTRPMHLSPWVSGHPLLAEIAVGMIIEKSTFNKTCLAERCCADVQLTINEIIYSIGNWEDWPKDRSFVYKNFHLNRRPTGKCYYHSFTPICRIIHFLRESNLHLKSKKEISELNYLSTPEAGKLLQCSSGTVLQLAELGYLQRSSQNQKSGSGHRALITKLSVKHFRDKFILVGQISNLLKTTPIKTVRLLNQLGISSDHDKLGPYVYEQYIIHAAWEKLEKALKNPPSLFPIVLPPTQGVHNSFKTINLNSNVTEEDLLQQPVFITERTPEDNRCCYTTNEAATFLNISGKLLQYRFVLTGLITPEFIDRTPRYSLAHINTMSSHLQQHLSIEQITRIFRCGRNKTNRLLNSFNLKPSCILLYSNGDKQSLYSKAEIYDLSTRPTTKKRKGTIKSKSKSNLKKLTSTYDCPAVS